MFQLWITGFIYDSDAINIVVSRYTYDFYKRAITPAKPHFPTKRDKAARDSWYGFDRLENINDYWRD